MGESSGELDGVSTPRGGGRRGGPPPMTAPPALGQPGRVQVRQGEASRGE